MPNNQTEQALSLIRKHLVEDSDVTALVDDRIAGRNARRTSEDSNSKTSPHLVIDQVGGVAAHGSSWQKLIIHIYGYSNQSQAEATRVADAAYNSLNGNQMKADGISVEGVINCTSTPETGFNDQTGEYFARRTFSFFGTNQSS